MRLHQYLRRSYANQMSTPHKARFVREGGARIPTTPKLPYPLGPQHFTAGKLVASDCMITQGPLWASNAKTVAFAPGSASSTLYMMFQDWRILRRVLFVSNGVCVGLQEGVENYPHPRAWIWYFALQIRREAPQAAIVCPRHDPGEEANLSPLFSRHEPDAHLARFPPISNAPSPILSLFPAPSWPKSFLPKHLLFTKYHILRRMAAGKVDASTHWNDAQSLGTDNDECSTCWMTGNFATLSCSGGDFCTDKCSGGQERRSSQKSKQPKSKQPLKHAHTHTHTPPSPPPQYMRRSRKPFSIVASRMTQQNNTRLFPHFTDSS